MIKAKIENVNGSPAIVINGIAYPPMMATIRRNNDGNGEIDKEYYSRLGKSGIKIYFLICNTEWLDPGSFEDFKEEAEQVLSAVPDAYIIPRISLHPPTWWIEQNPDETVWYSDGKKKKTELFTESFCAELPAMYSLSSQKWRSDAGKALLDTIDLIEKSSFGDRIAGYFFAAGGTSEWYYLTPTEYTSKTMYADTGGFDKSIEKEFDNVYADLSPAFRREFSQYLKDKYGTDENLQSAWKNPSATINNPEIPNCNARYFIDGVDYDLKNPGRRLISTSPEPPLPSNGTNIGHFLDMEKHQDVFDFFRAWHLGTANSVIYFGNIVKKHSPNLLTGAFYGSAGACRFFSFGQIGGVTNILDSDAIDFLASPPVYENRQPGGFEGTRQVFDSFRLKNRIFVVEDDSRTHLENNYYKPYFELFNMDDSLNTLKRDFGRDICQDLQAWWFDQHKGGGRYKAPEFYDLFAKQQKIAREAYSLDRIKNSEIAAIYDEESYHVVSEETNHQMVELFRNYEIDLIGAPVDRYYHNDMSDPNMPDYKLYLFMNTFYLTDIEREVIKKKLAKNGAYALFMYGSGVINPDAQNVFDVANMEKLTGISMGMENVVRSGKFKFQGEHEIARRLDKGEIYGDFVRKMWANACTYLPRIKLSQVNLYPHLYADDEQAEPIAYFLHSGKPAVSIKKADGFTSVYCGSKYLSANIVREIARFAGCHIYSNNGDVLYANKNYITIHASASGKKTLHLPDKKDLYEVYTEQYYGRGTDEITFEMLKGQTLMFKVL